MKTISLKEKKKDNKKKSFLKVPFMIVWIKKINFFFRVYGFIKKTLINNTLKVKWVHSNFNRPETNKPKLFI